METGSTVKELVFGENGRAVTDSLLIAETFSKRHADVLRSIENLECSQEFNERNFALVDYKDTKGEKRPKYIISQDGFAFLVMGYTGKASAVFKELFIKQFNRMRDELNSLKLPTTYKQALLALVDAEEEKERLQLENTTLLLQAEENQPLVTFAETCLKSNDTILVRELVKVAQDQSISIGEKRLWIKLREWNLILKSSTEPSQYGMTLKLFEVEEKSITTAYGEKLVRQTRVLPKGQVFIIEKLKKELLQFKK